MVAGLSVSMSEWPSCPLGPHSSSVVPEGIVVVVIVSTIEFTAIEV